VGYQALYANTTGGSNDAFGYGALDSNTTGSQNAAFGVGVLQANTTGSYNIGMGRTALESSTTASYNTAIGQESMRICTTGSYNTAVGKDSLEFITTGDNNVSIGKSAGDNITSGNGNIIIGTNVDAQSATASNQLNIGNWIKRSSGGDIVLSADASSSQVTLLNNGNLLIGTTNASPAETTNVAGTRIGSTGGSQFSKTSNPCQILNRMGTYGALMEFRWQGSIKGHIDTDGSGTTYYTSSDYRLKENVVPMTGSIDRLKTLKPSRFNFIADADKTVDGFLAHEAQEVVPEAISGTKDAVDDEGNPDYQGIDQSKLVPLLVSALQEAVSRIETLEAQLNA
jgi:hypothetical protein